VIKRFLDKECVSIEGSCFPKGVKCEDFGENQDQCKSSDHDDYLGFNIIVLFLCD
jgi:hypothetical protein